MITLNVDKMRKASNAVFIRRLDSYHESLIHDSQYKHILDHVTFCKYDNGLIFKSSYIRALAYISKELTSDYITDFIFNSSKFSGNSMCSGAIYWNVMSVNGNNSILDKLYIYLILSRATDYKESGLDAPKMTIYENYIHIDSGFETGFVNLTHAGKKLESGIPVLGFSITNNKEVCILSQLIKNGETDRSTIKIFTIKDSIILADVDKGEIHMINIEKYKNYSKEHPFIEIKEEYKLKEVYR